jgi:hypothetical protein
MRKFKVSRPIIYAVVALIGVAGYLMTSEEVARRGAPNRRPATTAATNLPEGFTEEDLKAKFTVLNDPARDAFKPLVARKAVGTELATSPDAVPSVLTGGDPNWVYTGMAEIDGVPQGLLENRSTGEGVFVKHSESWKQARVTQITPTSIVLVGSNGKPYTMRLVDSEITDAQMMAGGGFTPVQPRLQGPIGNVAVVPENQRGGNGEGAVAQERRGNRTNSNLNVPTEVTDEN